jgi:hypothetical protein
VFEIIRVFFSATMIFVFKSQDSVLGVFLSAEGRVRAEVAKFVQNGIKNIRELTADELIRESAINPFLVKALGIADFDSLARFYVYQRIGRSLVTSFGTTMEHMIRALAGGEKIEWWDVKKAVGNTTYYMSVKSGPRDMDKDQVQHFAGRAKEIMRTDRTALPVIAMGYGTEPMGVIAPTLRNEGLPPDRHTLTGKQLYDTITGQNDYHIRLLELTGRIAFETLGNRRFIDLIENKVREIAEGFRNRFGSVDELLLGTF